MSILILYNKRRLRIDAMRIAGSPPVVAPPAWALAERVWESVDAPFPPGPPRIDPSDWCDASAAAVPQGCGRLVLVAPDATRVGAWRFLLPGLLATLSRLRNAQKTLLVATGLHALARRDDLLRHLLPFSDDPERDLDGWTVAQNGDDGYRSHEGVGITDAGTVVRLHPAYLRADWRILLGEVSYHYFAGFGGGRKLVFPGVASPEGVAMNHRRALRVATSRLEHPETPGMDGIEWNPACAPGSLQGNPVNEDLEAAAALAPPHWALTAVDRPTVDPDPASPCRFPVQVVQGAYPIALEEAVEAYEALHRLHPTKRPKRLVVDAGGSPRDSTFLQAHKSLQHAVRFVPRRARILLIAGCAGGLGSATLERYVAQGESFRPLEGLEENPVAALHLQTLVALRQAVGYSETALLSSLDPGVVRALGMHPVTSECDARAWLRSGAGESWGWLPRAERFLPVDAAGQASPSEISPSLRSS